MALSTDGDVEYWCQGMINGSANVVLVVVQRGWWVFHNGFFAVQGRSGYVMSESAVCTLYLSTLGKSM